MSVLGGSRRCGRRGWVGSLAHSGPLGSDTHQGAHASCCVELKDHFLGISVAEG